MLPLVSCLWFGCLLFYCQSLNSQQLLFENYSSEQGLSQNSCYTIAQDADGFMWFGTQDGLNRYDGKQFKVFLPQSDIGKKLPSNYISSLLFDNHDKLLWIGTIRGACIYHPARDSLVKITELFPFASLLENVPVKKIVSFKENEYWIITFNKGLLFLNTKSGIVTSFFNDAGNHARISSIVQHGGKIIVALLNELFYLCPKENSYQPQPIHKGYFFPEIKELFSYNNVLWIGTLTEGCFYINDPVENSSLIHPFKINPGGIGCFITDADGKLWIGTRGRGIIQYDPRTETIQTAIHNQYDSRSLGKNFVLSMFRDRQGIIWCGLSGSGLAKYDPLKYQFRTISNEPVNPTSLPDNMIFDIYKCRDGSYFIGTQNKGITEWNSLTNQFFTYSESSKIGVAINTIYDMTEDDNNNLWIASWGGLMQLDRQRKKILFYDEKRLLIAKKLYGIIKLKGADSLFITGENGPSFFSLKDRQWKSWVENPLQANASVGRFIYEDEKNVLWICTIGAGLVKYDYRRQQFEIIEAVKKYSNYVRHLFQDDSLFWLATDNGIVLYDYEKKKTVKHITLNTSNLSGVCYAIEKDKKGFFWVSTNTGLYKINPHNYSFQKYDIGNGLSFLEYNTASVLKEDDGSLLFGGVGGLTLFDPSLLKENTFSPSPLITALHVNEIPWQLNASPSHITNLTFNHNQNFITIYFAVNNFSNESNNQFSYRLKGLNDSWTNSDTRNYAAYTSLPPGDYVFELRSANSDGKWSEGITKLAITIHPPWWGTWWFRMMVLLVLTGLIIYFVGRRIKTIRREANLKQKIAETEMMALRAQMNPHFIFNSLNSIREMILNNENKLASHYLSKFAHLMRLTLEQSSQAFITLRNTLDYLRRYIEMEQIRNSHFAFTLSVDEALNIDETVLPPMLIQPFIENAIWHGTAGQHKDIHIDIRFKKEDNQLICIIDDNGIGIERSLDNKKGDSKDHHSVGIENIKNRIHLLNEEYNVQSSVIIEDKNKIRGNKESGTVVTLRLPLEITEE